MFNSQTKNFIYQLILLRSGGSGNDMRKSALLIGVLFLLFAGMASAYVGVGYNQNYWYGGRYLGNGVPLFGYGMYNHLPMNAWEPYDSQPLYYGSTRPVYNARYGAGIVSPRYGYGVISPRYGDNFQSPYGYGMSARYGMMNYR